MFACLGCKGFSSNPSLFYCLPGDRYICHPCALIVQDYKERQLVREVTEPVNFLGEHLEPLFLPAEGGKTIELAAPVPALTRSLLEEDFTSY